MAWPHQDGVRVTWNGRQSGRLQSVRAEHASWALAGRSEDMELSYQLPAVQGVRATMDLDHKWMRLVPRWHQPALDVAAVRELMVQSPADTVLARFVRTAAHDHRTTRPVRDRRW